MAFTPAQEAESIARQPEHRIITIADVRMAKTAIQLQSLRRHIILAGASMETHDGRTMIYVLRLLGAIEQRYDEIVAIAKATAKARADVRSILKQPPP